MKYYSEKLKKVFDDVETLEKAELTLVKKEEEEKKLREERKVRAKEVEDAYKHFNELLNKFIKDYGSYHMSVDNQPISLFDLMWRWPF